MIPVLKLQFILKPTTPTRAIEVKSVTFRIHKSNVVVLLRQPYIFGFRSSNTTIILKRTVIITAESKVEKHRGLTKITLLSELSSILCPLGIAFQITQRNTVIQTYYNRINDAINCAIKVMALDYI